MSTTTPSATETTAPPVTMHKLLTGQKALVTGANSGIGKAVAIALGAGRRRRRRQLCRW